MGGNTPQGVHTLQCEIFVRGSYIRRLHRPILQVRKLSLAICVVLCLRRAFESFDGCFSIFSTARRLQFNDFFKIGKNENPPN